ESREFRKVALLALRGAIVRARLSPRTFVAARRTQPRRNLRFEISRNSATVPRNMDPTYTILGGEGNHYGPVTAEQFRDWAREGRVNGQTQVMRGNEPNWVLASALPELAVSPGSPAAPVATMEP